MIKDIPATVLRGVALETIRGLQDPAHFQFENLSCNAEGQPVPIWSDEAIVLSEIGHIYKAAQRFYKITGEPKAADLTRINQCVNLLDAQIRTILRKGENVPTMVTLSVKEGRKKLIEVLGMAAERLEGGDEMIVQPAAVGVILFVKDEYQDRKDGAED